MPLTEKNAQKAVWVAALIFNLVETVFWAGRGNLTYSLIFAALTVAFTWQSVRMFRT